MTDVPYMVSAIFPESITNLNRIQLPKMNAFVCLHFKYLLWAVSHCGGCIFKENTVIKFFEVFFFFLSSCECFIRNPIPILERVSIIM